jgi:STE24 endopeptidase
MDENAAELNFERQRSAKEYARIRRRLWALNLGISAIYISAWVFMNWGARVLEATAGAWDLPGWALILIVAMALGLPISILTLPLSYYSSYHLPHRFGLSTQTFKGWFVDQVKSVVLSAMIGVPLLLGFYALIDAAPQNWWFWAAAGFTLVTVVLAILAPIILMPIFNTFTPLSQDHKDLVDRLLALANRVGTNVRGVYSFDMSRRTTAANAAITGLGKTRRIILGDTLLEEFSPDEIETVLAHELGHQVHRDIPLQLIFQTSFNFIGFFMVSILLENATQTLEIGSAADPAGLPLIGLLFGIFGLLTMPVVNAFSRWRERMADDFALKTTNNPRAFAGAMTRLANQNLSDVDPEDWVIFLFYSHPPLRERINRAQSFS